MGAGYSDIDDIYPLSSMQEGMLYHTLRDPQSYFCQASYRLHTVLDLRAFLTAWRRVFGRHPVLRTSIVWKQLDRPVQVVHSRVDLPCNYVDLTELQGPLQRQAISVFLCADRQRGFDLSTAPLVRLALIRTGVNDYEFIWSCHHLILDGWSNWLLFKEYWTLYGACCALADLNLPAPAPFRNYIAWLQQQDTTAAERFWRAKLHNVSPTAIVTGNAQTSGCASETIVHEEIASLADTDEIKRVARVYRITVNTFLHGAWALVLSCLAGASDIVFDATLSGRHAPLDGMDHMVGLFINTIPVRVHVDRRSTAANLLHGIQRDWVEAMHHAGTPYSRIKEWSGIPAGTALSDVLIVFENYPTNAFEQHYGDPQTKLTHAIPLQVQSGGASESTNYPLTLLADASGQLRVKVLYNASQIDPAYARRLPRLLIAVMRAAAHNMEAGLESVELVEGAEREKVLEQWNETRQQWLRAGNLVEEVAEQARRTPEAIAVVCGGEHLSYAGLQERAHRVAQVLVAEGVKAEDRVGVCVERSLELVVSLVGILEAGAAFVPLDGEYPSERLAYMVAQAGVQLVLCGGGSRLPEGVGVRQLEVRECLEAESGMAVGKTIGEQQLAYVIYTSGSTGRPKGAMNTQAGICNRVWWMQEQYRLGGGDRVLQKTPIGFDVSVAEIFWPLFNGATLVMARPGKHRDSRYLLEAMETEQITTIHFVPSMLEVFVEELEEGRGASVRCVMTSGEALSEAVSLQLQQRWPKIELYNLYGPTEASVEVTWWKCGQETGRPVPIGRPIANTQVYVLDENGRLAPVGVPGELYIGGVGVGRGYVNQPGLTAERFVPDGYGREAGGRLYRTGDRVRWREDGQLEYLGRLDYQVKIRGQRVELGEIEEVLRAQKGVAGAVAALRSWGGGGDARLVAYVVTARDVELEASDLRAAMRARLPEYMVPQVVVLPEFPRLPSGKIDWRALPEPEAVQSPQTSARDSIEAHLTQIWEDLLERSGISIRDDFFELGGHSLKAITLASRISKAFKLEMSVDAVLPHRTIELLANFIRQSASRSTSRSSLVPIHTTGSQPPLFCVHPGSGLVHCYLKLSRHLGPDQPVYAFQSVALTGVDSPHTSVETMSTRYIEDLKLAFPSGPYQLVGLSMGAVVAYEMAQQLTRSGEQVSFVGLLDGTYSETPINFFEGNWEAESRAWVQHHVLKNATERFGILHAEMAGLNEESRLKRYLDEAKAHDVVPADVTVSQFARLLEVFATNERAMRSYSPQRFDGLVALVRCDLSDSALGWSKYIRIWREALIGHHHGDCIEEPFVQTLAKFLNDAMRDACKVTDREGISSSYPAAKTVAVTD